MLQALSNLIQKLKRKPHREPKHPNVDRIFLSPFFNRAIIVHHYEDDWNWHFRFYGTDKIYRAQSPLSVYIDNGWELPDFPYDDYIKLPHYRNTKRIEEYKGYAKEIAKDYHTNIKGVWRRKP